MGGPEMAPHTPQRSSRPGVAVARLDPQRSSRSGAAVARLGRGYDFCGLFRSMAGGGPTACSSRPRSSPTPSSPSPRWPSASAWPCRHSRASRRSSTIRGRWTASTPTARCTAGAPAVSPRRSTSPGPPGPAARPPYCRPASHVQPVFGAFTPRQRTMDFIDSGMNGGVTTAISAGEVHLPGRPKDIVGLKALAIVAAKSYANFRPGGVKVHAGAPILELGMTEDDFAEMAAAGVRLVGEIGLGSVKTGKDAAPMVRWARAHGMTVTIHTGGPSIAGSSPINADVVLEAAPDVVGHVNGGTTSMTPAEIERLVATDMALEIVQCGNMKTALHTLRVARDARPAEPRTS